MFNFIIIYNNKEIRDLVELIIKNTILATFQYYSKKGYDRGFGLYTAKNLIDRYKKITCVTEINNVFLYRA